MKTPIEVLTGKFEEFANAAFNITELVKKLNEECETKTDEDETKS